MNPLHNFDASAEKTSRAGCGRGGEGLSGRGYGLSKAAR